MISFLIQKVYRQFYGIIVTLIFMMKMEIYNKTAFKILIYYDERLWDMSGLYFPLGYLLIVITFRPWFPRRMTLLMSQTIPFIVKGWEIGVKVYTSQTGKLYKILYRLKY